MDRDFDRVLTDADFEQVNWHDNAIHGISFHIPEPEINDWASDLIFDIDHILEWCATEGGGFQFRVAPAWLVFHDVFEHRFSLAWDPSLSALPTVHVIERELDGYMGVRNDIPRFRWTIRLNVPSNGVISFTGTGFTQTLRHEAVLQDQQWITPSMRQALLGSASPSTIEGRQ